MINVIFFILFTLTITSNEDLLSLIKAEKSFSALAGEKGIRTAFISYFDDDAIVFAPKPVKGKQRYISRDTIPGNLSWEPEFADIAQSGNLGYTTGPWKLERNSEIGFGHFVSIWEKKDNEWKVILDTGIDYPDPYGDIKEVNSSSALKKKIYYKEDKEKTTLFLLDKALNSSSKYNRSLSDNIIILRMGSHPIIGVSRTLNYFKNNKNTFDVNHEFLKISESGDLAYSYGQLIYNNTEQDSYLRIWTNAGNDGWRLTLELIKSAK